MIILDIPSLEKLTRNELIELCLKQIDSVEIIFQKEEKIRNLERELDAAEQEAKDNLDIVHKPTKYTCIRCDNTLLGTSGQLYCSIRCQDGQIKLPNQTEQAQQITYETSLFRC
jgi:hypothetical protein